MRKPQDIIDIDTLTAEVAQPILSTDEDYRSSLYALSVAIIKNDEDAFRELIEKPCLRNIHKKQNDPFVMRNSDQFMQTMRLSFGKYLGFYNRTNMVDIYLEKLNRPDAQGFALAALDGAKYGKDCGDTIKHVVRRFSINVSFFQPEDFRRLIRRRDHDTLAFLLAKGANPNVTGALSERPPLFEALHQENAEAARLLLKANVIQHIANNQDSYSFIRDEKTAAFIGHHADKLALKNWLAEQYLKIEIKPYQTVTDLRRQIYHLDYKGRKVEVNGLMAMTLNRDFSDIVKTMIETGETLNRDDLYSPSCNMDISVMEMLNHLDYAQENIVRHQSWAAAPERMRDLFNMLAPYDQYKREDDYRASIKRLFDPEKRMSRVRQKMPSSKPLKRRRPKV